MRLAPQGITGTSYLEIDYVDPPPPLLPIDWKPDNIYIPSAPSTVTTFVNAAERNHRPAAQARHRGHARQSQQAAGDDQRAHRRDRHQGAVAAQRARAGQDRERRSTTSRRRSSPTRASRCSRSCARPTPSSRRLLANPALQKLPDDAAAAMARDQGASSTDPKLAKTLAQPRAHADARRPHPRRRRGRPRDHDREPAPDHRQPARPDRGRPSAIRRT